MEAVSISYLRNWGRTVRGSEFTYSRLREGHRKRAAMLKTRSEMFRKMTRDIDLDTENPHQRR